MTWSGGSPPEVCPPTARWRGWPDATERPAGGICHGVLSGPNRALPPGGGPLRRYKAAFDTFAPGTQRALLEAEGVAFRLDGTVDLEQCLWTPES